MFSILDRYIGRTILGNILGSLLILVGLSAIIKFADQLRRTGHGDYDTIGAGIYTLLSVPRDIDTFFPMAALLGALIGLGILASRSELVAMESSGYTRTKIASSVMKTAIPLVIVSMIIGEWVSPIGEQTARNLRAYWMYGSSLVSNQGVSWAKDGNDFIFIGNISDETTLSNIYIYSFNVNLELKTLTHAASAVFNKTEQLWDLSQVTILNFSDELQISSNSKIREEWKTTLTPEQLGIVVLKPESLSARELYQYITYRKNSELDYSQYELILWGRLFSPLSMAVMMMLALSFVFGPLRNVSMGLRVVTGITFGFIFYVFNQVFGRLSLVYNLPPILGATIPSLCFLLLSIYLLKKRQ